MEVDCPLDDDDDDDDVLLDNNITHLADYIAVWYMS